jgi:hypothetical protein
MMGILAEEIAKTKTSMPLARGRNHRQKQMRSTKVNGMGNRPHKR